MKRDFDEMMLSLKKSIMPSDFFVDFSKVYLNIKQYEVHLNILNTLIGKENIEEEFIELVNMYPEVVHSIPILLATHSSKFSIVNIPTVQLLKSISEENFEIFEEKYVCYDFNQDDYSAKDYASFLRESGLFDLISNRKIKNLVDYAIGIEVGLDSNSRKNRGGMIMEDIVEEFLKLSKIDYHKQMKYKEIDEIYGTNLCSIGKATKKFDFVYKSKNDNKVIVMEVNYYGKQGSKPNETAKSYIELDKEINSLEGVKFVWITDGYGWTKSRLNLEDAYDKIEHLYNINDLENGILEKL